MLLLLQHLENERLGPLDVKESSFPAVEFHWIYKSGIHIGFDADDDKLVYMVKIFDPKTTSTEDQLHLTKALQGLMDYARTVPPITTNKAQKLTRIRDLLRDEAQNAKSVINDFEDEDGKSIPSHHAERGDKSIGMMEPKGSMYGVGWHGSQEAGKNLVAYAHKRTRLAYKIACKLMDDNTLLFIQQFYAHEFSKLSPLAVHTMVKISERFRTPPFGQVSFDGNDRAFPFCPNLTMTIDDFSNLFHLDRDICEYVFGIWWAAEVIDFQSKAPSYTLPATDAHAKIKGGEFVWAEYLTGVDFQRCIGIVEIMWLGCMHFHATMSSISEDGYTRFGSSVQIGTGVTSGSMNASTHANPGSRIIDGEQRVKNVAEHFATRK